MKNNEKKISDDDISNDPVQDGYAQFLSEWKSSAYFILVSVMVVIGIGLFVFERQYLWQRLF